MFHTLTNVRIAGMRVAVPTNEIRLEDEAEFYGGSTKKIARLKATLGMDRRRVCPPDVTASDLCAHAAVNLMDALPGSRDDIDVLVFVSQTPDWQQPATACELQHRLGLKTSCAAFDVNQGCSGYIYGLWLASSLIAAGSARQALLLVGHASPHCRLDVRNRVVAPVFGDGGSATLLVRDEQAPPMYYGLGTDGSGFEVIITPAGESRIPFSLDEAENTALVRDISDPAGNIWHLANLYMDGGAVFDFTMSVVPAHLREALEHAALTTEDIDQLVLHQANRQIVLNIAEKAGFPASRTPSDSFSKYGNLEAVSIPAALCDAFGGGQAPGRVLLCGYGIGLSWASCICTLDQWNSAPLLEFEADPCRPTRQQRIERWEQILRGERSRHE